MRIIKTTLAALAAVGMSCGAAAAADLYTPPAEPAPVYVAPPFSWTGFYAGVQLGYGWGDVEATNAAGSIGIDIDGGVGGAHAGFNYQWNRLVLGVEGDVETSGVDGTLTAGGASATAEQKWLASIRGRLGVAFDRLLLYGTGGWAVSEFEYRSGAGRDSATHNGWTAGGGLEYAMTDHLTTRVEYRYADFGEETVFGAEVEPTTHTIRVGLGYKF